jgi:2'-5' RNA ligase
VRLFIAAKIPDSIKERIREFQESTRVPEGVRWIRQDNLHLTLKFLGETPEKLVEPITERVHSVLRGTGAFEVSFSTFGGFPNLRHPRILWIGVEQGKEELIDLMDKLNRKLSHLGFEMESRKPKPHLTIGRIRKGCNIEIGARDFKEVSFPAETVCLIRSELTPQGPIYTDVGEFELQKI